MLDVVAQIGIALCGVGSTYLVGLKNPRIRRWGYVTGMCAQPFWLYTTISHEQWGIVILCAFYFYSWFNGFRNHWKQGVTTA